MATASDNRDAILLSTENLSRKSTDLSNLLDKHGVEDGLKGRVNTFLDTYTRVLNPDYAAFQRESEKLKKSLKQFFDQEINKNKEDRVKKDALKTASEEITKEVEQLEALRKAYDENQMLKALADTQRALNIADETKYPLVAAINKQGEVDPEFKRKTEEALQKAQNTYHIKEIGTINGRMHFYAEVDPDHPELAAASGEMLVNVLAAKGATDITLSYAGSFEQIDAAYKRAVQLGMVFKIETDWSHILKSALLSPVSMLLSGVWSAGKIAHVKARSAPYVAISEEFAKLKHEKKNTGDPLVVYNYFKDKATKLVDGGNPISQSTRDKGKEHLEHYLPLLDKEQIDSLFQRYDGTLSTLITDLKTYRSSSLSGVPLVGRLFDEPTFLKDLSLAAVAARADVLTDAEIGEILTTQGKRNTDPRPPAAITAAAPTNSPLDYLLANLSDNELTSLKLRSTQINTAAPSTTAPPNASVIAQILTTKSEHLSPELRLLAINYLSDATDVNAVVTNMTDEQAKELDFTEINHYGNLNATSLKKIFKDRPINDTFATFADNTAGLGRLVPLYCEGLTTEQQNALLQNSKFGAATLNLLIQDIAFDNTQIRQISNETLCVRMSDLDATSRSKILTAKRTTLSDFINGLSDAALKKLNLSDTQINQIQPSVLKAKAQHFNETTVAAIIESHYLQNDDLNQFINSTNNDSLKTINFPDIDFYFNQLNNVSLNKLLANRDGNAILTFWLNPPPQPPAPGAPAVVVPRAAIALAKNIKIIEALPAAKIATIYNLDANPNVQDRADILNELTFNNGANNDADKAAKIDAVLTGLNPTQVGNVFSALIAKANKNTDVLSHIIKYRLQPGDAATLTADPNFQTAFDAIEELNNTTVTSTPQVDQLLTTAQDHLYLLKPSFIRNNINHLSSNAVKKIYQDAVANPAHKNGDTLVRLLNSNLDLNQKITLLRKLDAKDQYAVLANPNLKDDNVRLQIYKDVVQNSVQETNALLAGMSSVQIDALTLKTQADYIAQQTSEEPSAIHAADQNYIKQMTPLLAASVTSPTFLQDFGPRAQATTSNWNGQSISIRPHPRADLITQYLAVKAYIENATVSQTAKDGYINSIKQNTNHVFDELQPDLQLFLFEQQQSSLTQAEKRTLFAASNPKTCLNLLKSTQIDRNEKLLLIEKHKNSHEILAEDIFGNESRFSKQLPLSSQLLDNTYTYYQTHPVANRINPIIALLNSGNFTSTEKLTLLNKLSPNLQLEIVKNKELTDDNLRYKAYKQLDTSPKRKALALGLDNDQLKVLIKNTQTDYATRQTQNAPALSWIQSTIDTQEDSFKAEMNPLLSESISKTPPAEDFLAQFDEEHTSAHRNQKMARLTQSLAVQEYFNNPAASPINQASFLANVKTDHSTFEKFHPDLQVFLFDKLNSREQEDLFKNVNSEVQLNLLKSNTADKVALIDSLSNDDAKNLVDTFYDDSAAELHTNMDKTQRPGFFKTFGALLTAFKNSTKGGKALNDLTTNNNNLNAGASPLRNALYTYTAKFSGQNSAQDEQDFENTVSTLTPTP